MKWLQGAFSSMAVTISGTVAAVFGAVVAGGSSPIPK
jgi:broad specificity polyphosphatase/5'/3'-nucleotidase SurE